MIGFVSGVAVFVFVMGVASLDPEFLAFWTGPLRRYKRRGRHRDTRKSPRTSR